MDKCTKMAALYIATLKAITLVHQHSHWLAKGNDFYGDHLLFQRIYETAQGNLDGAAEKMIGVIGDDCMDFKMQADLLNKLLLKYSDKSDDVLSCSLAIEEDFVKFSKALYECFENEGKMTLGLDDFIMATASQHEESLYLLRRASSLDEA